mmetsp:Transcript_2886/g.7756  ORF Transcript_2886/g.7756 Transcript_2886/m.7756 type:complete len:92 (-) Transcript_2886:210-485(-)
MPPRAAAAQAAAQATSSLNCSILSIYYISCSISPASATGEAARLAAQAAAYPHADQHSATALLSAARPKEVWTHVLTRSRLLQEHQAIDKL